MTYELRDYYESYELTHPVGTAPRRVLKSQIIDRLPKDLDGIIIDVGCGQGALVEAIASAGYPRVLGVDISPEQVAIAHRRGITQVEHGDAVDALRRYRGDVAAVTATDLLEHLTRQEIGSLLAEVYAALQPGGTLIARVPNAVSPMGGHIRHGDVTHESWFTARSARQMALVAGFDEVSAYECPPLPHGLKNAVRVAIWKIFSGTMKLGLAAETGVLGGHIVTMNLVFVARKARDVPA